MTPPFLGVLGGMGPSATADFLQKLAGKTPAGADQEHIPVILYGDCTTPDRTASIVADGASPLPQLLKGIRFLNDSGVAAICIPCNSAHCWFTDLEAASNVPLLHIVRASVAQLHTRNSAAKAIGLLSTYGIHRIGVYQRELSAMGYLAVSPTDWEYETLISPAIAMNKANKWEEAEELYETAAGRLTDRGAEVILLGCTEIPLGMRRQMSKNPAKFIDSNEALADAVVAFFNGWRVCGKCR